MTADELKGAMLAEQRHTFLDLDADSTAQCVDRQLCEHGHPLGSAGVECVDCRTMQSWQHVIDDEPIGGLLFCRRCGMSLGTHGKSCGFPINGG